MVSLRRDNPELLAGQIEKAFGFEYVGKVAQILSVTLVLCNTAMAGNGRFTLVPSGGSVPFQATCFDDIATAKLLTWREFQETEFENRLRFELDLQSEKYTLELNLRDQVK